MEGREAGQRARVVTRALPAGGLPPVVVCDRSGFRVLLHFAQTGAPGHPGVQVLLLTMMSTAPQPVQDVMFQVAVPKVSVRCPGL